MDIRELKYFVAIAETLNFTEAAKKLYVAQSTLSQQISNLEKKIDVKLFLRNSHSVQLTASGIVLLKEAKAIINKAENALQIVRQAEYGIAGNLNIGFLGAAERPIIPKLMALFRRKYPKITLTFLPFDMPMLDNALRQSNVDVGLTLAVPQDKLPGLSWKLIYTDTLQFALPNHTLLNEDNINFFRLEQETFLFISPGRGLDNLIRICSRRGITPNINLVNNPELLFLSIASGAGVSILPRAVLNNYAPNLRRIDLDGEDSHVNLITAWKQGRNNPCIPIFIKEVESIAKSVPCE